MSVNRFALSAGCPAQEAVAGRGHISRAGFNACVDELLTIDRTAWDSEGSPVEVTESDIDAVSAKFGLTELREAVAGCFANRRDGTCQNMQTSAPTVDIIKANEKYL